MEKLRLKVGCTSGRLLTQMDTFEGLEYDPVTLHKYLYANADPALYTDPTGNFSLSELSTAKKMSAVLTTLAVIDTGYSLFELATGKEELSAFQLGLSVLLSRVPGSGFAKMIARKFKRKTGKDLKIPCVRNSFVAGTLVHTERGLVEIENVKIGDYVLSFNEKTGKNEYQEVVHLIRNTDEYELVNIEIASEESFVSTIEHPFYSEGVWKKAGELSLSENVKSIDGSLQISEISILNTHTLVYNFTVSNTENYYIGKSGILVHNVGNDCIGSVGNIDEFFKTPFGSGLKNISQKLGGNKMYQGQRIYKADKKAGSIKQGYHFYLDPSEKNHLEVFDKNGNFKFVLDLDGTKNDGKTTRALGRTISNIIN